MIKEMNDTNLQHVLDIIGHWWRNEDITEEELQARVVLIYKKGDTNKYENYRPISLLNTLYKLFAAILQRRISKTLDKHLQTTQFGFRKDKSTADAIHLIRRVIEYGESTQNQLHLLLLDWEKAFDKVDRKQLLNSMIRMNVDPKLVNLVKSIYKDTKFTVEIDGESSTLHTQHTGIRQGCPLSPYLFLIVMTTMFHDVHKNLDNKLQTQRVPGAEFDEVTYADDTICIATDTRTLNEFAKAIEKEGKRYGMKLNKAKCEVISTHPNANIHFPDGTKIRHVRTSTYLGCDLGIKSTIREELNKRFANTMITIKSLDLFWRHSDCGVAIKIQVADAVIRSKLLYGMESAQLIPSVLKRVETLQLKILRKILRMDTTYVNRDNTNERVYEKANEKLREERRKKKVVPFKDAFVKAKMKRAGKIIKNRNSPIYRISFQGNLLRKWIHDKRRSGRPRMNWTEETIKEIWDHIKKHEGNETDRFTPFSSNSEYIINKIHEHAISGKTYYEDTNNTRQPIPPRPKRRPQGPHQPQNNTQHTQNTQPHPTQPTQSTQLTQPSLTQPTNPPLSMFRQGDNLNGYE